MARLERQVVAIEPSETIYTTNQEVREITSSHCCAGCVVGFSDGEGGLVSKVG